MELPRDRQSVTSERTGPQQADSLRYANNLRYDRDCKLWSGVLHHYYENHLPIETEP
jgi:hypothetical protein